MILVARGNIHPMALSDSLDLKVSQPLMRICKHRGCMEVQIQLSTDDNECY